MKNKLIYIIYLFVLCIISPSLIADDCEDVFEVIQTLYGEKKWKETKVECESYLRNCGTRAQVEKILRESEEHLRRRSIPKFEVEKVEKKNFIVTPLNIEFSYAGGQTPISITTDGLWDVYDAPGWVDFEMKNNILTIVCGVNYQTSAREDEIVLMDEYNNKAQINVFQDKNPDYLRLSANRIYEEDAHGGTYTIKVNSNKSWYVNSYPSWCEIEKLRDQIKVTLNRNYEGYERKGQIEVLALSNGLNLRSVISVGQAKLEHYLLLSSSGFSDKFGKGSKSVPIEVETDLGYFHIENIPSWCEIEDKTATSFSVKLLKNKGGGARSAQLKVVAGNQSRLFTISQVARPLYIDVDPSETIIASQRGGYVIYNVESNCGVWRIVNLPDWCEVEEETPNSFKINILPNEGDPRSATFSVSASGNKCNLTIKQE